MDNPPPESPPKVARRKRSRKMQPSPNREILKAMRKLGLATSGLGPSAPEIFKAATLQCVQAKLEEIQKMLSWISAGATKNERDWPLDQGFNPGAPNPPTHQITPGMRQLTPEEADAQFLATKHAPKKEEVCQICGHDAVYVTKKKMPLCIVHRQQGIEDDRSDILAERMRLSGIGFGGQEEMIRVPQNLIDEALARGGDGE